MAGTSPTPTSGASALDAVARHFTGPVVLDVSPGWVSAVRRLDLELSQLDPAYRLASLEAHDGKVSVQWQPGDEPAFPQQPAGDDPEAAAAYDQQVREYLASVVHRRRMEWEDRIRDLGAAAVLRAWQEMAHLCEECGAATSRMLGRKVVCGHCQGLRVS